MSLLEIWKSTPSQVREKHVQQVIAFAGAGKLKDASQASDEFRSFLGHIPSPIIQRYAEECLADKFDDSGLALQDVINQVGRRLGFEVQYGRYRGTTNAIGFDGLWLSPFGQAIVVEVKTTDAYRIDLDTVANYRRKLIAAGDISGDKSSILIIVGRQDTGDLEAQIRGSRHAWDVRLISVDSLLRLVAVKESVENPQTDRRIGELLIPHEYTRVDSIIDLVFDAAKEATEEDELVDEGAQDSSVAAPHVEKKFTPASFHEACVNRIRTSLGVELLKRSRVVYSSPNEDTVVVCAISREYNEKGDPGYWFAFHPHQEERLKAAARGYVGLACGSAAKLLLIPNEKFEAFLPSLNVTTLEDRSYWHVHIYKEDGRLMLRPKKGQPRVDLTQFLLAE
jgi:hypothetical protein